MSDRKFNSRAEKKQAKLEAGIREAAAKYGLIVDRLTDEDLRNRNEASEWLLAEIFAEERTYSFGDVLLSDSASLVRLVELTRIQVEQNLILMRQNEEIIRLLKQLSDE